MRGQEFDFRRARGVVGHDCLDHAIGLILQKFVPEAVLVGLRADGRAALVPGVAFLDAFGGECEVVETCFGAYFDAFDAGGAEYGDGLDGGEMHDVELQVGGEVG